MKILVTGSSGRIGGYAVRDLSTAGHEVTGVDIIPAGAGTPRGLRVDLTDAGEVYQALARAKAQAVVHMGAWANAGIVPDARTYGDNVRGTFNVFQACADLGIRRVVSASSAQVYGLAKAPPLYVPMDEDHPVRPVNCYALSKTAGEQAAEFFVKNYGMTILSFRFMGIRRPAELERDIERIVADPAGGGGLLWTRMDARDAAMACRLAVEAEEVASGVYNITGSRVVLNEPPIELVRRHCGNDVEIRRDLPDFTSPLSCARAEAAFGYRPKFAWSVSERFPEQ